MNCPKSTPCLPRPSYVYPKQIEKGRHRDLEDVLYRLVRPPRQRAVSLIPLQQVYQVYPQAPGPTPAAAGCPGRRSQRWR